MEAIAELSGVSRRAGAKTIVEDATLQVMPGEFLAILGPNGAGKSTLLAILGAALRPSGGAVRLFGQNPWEISGGQRAQLRARIGVVPQRAEFNPLIPLTVREVVAIGRLRGRAFDGRIAREDEDVIEDSMQRMGIAAFGRRTYRSLSGGEQQKVQFARVLAQRPEMLLLDEPASGLDLFWQEHFTEIVGRLSEIPRLPVVMTTHILSHLPACARRAALMQRGRILFEGKADDALSAKRLSELYECPVEIIERGGRRHCLGAGTGAGAKAEISAGTATGACGP